MFPFSNFYVHVVALLKKPIFMLKQLTLCEQERRVPTSFPRSLFFLSWGAWGKQVAKTREITTFHVCLASLVTKTGKYLSQSWVCYNYFDHHLILLSTTSKFIIIIVLKNGEKYCMTQKNSSRRLEDMQSFFQSKCSMYVLFICFQRAFTI